ncbi:FAD-dependent oxidoreductase [bacterium]|nr:FAD-dependent oxidoreductase [bacterium]
MYSYWEKDLLQKKRDFVIVGSGFTGLNVAIAIKEQYKNASVLVIDREMWKGASTKNAGFACFGSPSEILHDMEVMGENECLQLVQKRLDGIERIAREYGKTAQYRACLSHEWFVLDNKELFENTKAKLPFLNHILRPITGTENTFEIGQNEQGNLAGVLAIKGEGQLQPALLHSALLKRAMQAGVKVCFNVEAQQLSANQVLCAGDLVLRARQVINCVNGFSGHLDSASVVKPARAQVLITSEIEQLPYIGNYHMDEGFYYFRNVGKRLLLGGARNLDVAGETTTELGANEKIQKALETLLKQTLLPGIDFDIDMRWSGIMGMRGNKLPKPEVHNEVLHLVGLSGMGVALSFSLSDEVLQLI